MDTEKELNTEADASPQLMRLVMYTLLEPEKYLGYYEHPVNDTGRYKVLSATIKNSRVGFDLRIKFEKGKKFYSWSPSVRGAKQKFAFQCSPGSKWKKCT